jgi:hypothetical protein
MVMKARSQNASFSGATPSGPRDIDPPGESIAVKLQSGLKLREWEPGEVDNWRDSGWSFPCRRRDCELEVVIAAVDPRWALQIRPMHSPGMIGRLLGRRPSATAADMHDLAAQVHQLLVSDGFRDLLWRWNGFPDEASSREPQPASE